MRIFYIAKHNSGGNDDEGAIAHALRELGHEVQCISEEIAPFAREVVASYDFLLCHHWRNLSTLSSIPCKFKVSWCFDLIDWPEPRIRHQERCSWAAEIAKVCNLSFFTDGDWVARDKSGKCQWLTQGADERLIPEWPLPLHEVDVLFVGGAGYGRGSLIEELSRTYSSFQHISHGSYGPRLRHSIRGAKVVVAPDSPVTDRYCSNRIYNITRMGAFLLHPKIEVAVQQYGNSVEFYESRGQLHRLVKWALGLDDEARSRGAKVGQDVTMTKHLYRHRCEELVRIVKERING